MLDTQNKLTYGKFVDGDETIDDVIVGANGSLHTRSFLVYTHGGVRVVERVIEVLDKLGARLNDKASARHIWPADNEIESEVLDCLSHARTEQAVRFLGHQRQHLAKAVSRIIRLINNSGTEALSELKKLVDSFDAVQRLLHSATVVLVGKPNAGKSTLFNRLVGRDAAVVTPIPGTTRDWVSESIEIRGIPITLVDTAGLRETADPLEQMAMGAGGAVSGRADLCIEVLDATDNLLPSTSEAIETKPTATRRIFVYNKIDLLDRMPAQIDRATTTQSQIVRISARVGFGLDVLATAIESHLGFSDLADSSSHLFTGRQVQLACMILSDPDKTNDRIMQFLREIIGERSVDGSSAGI